MLSEKRPLSAALRRVATSGYDRGLARHGDYGDRPEVGAAIRICGKWIIGIRAERLLEEMSNYLSRPSGNVRSFREADGQARSVYADALYAAVPIKLSTDRGKHLVDTDHVYADVGQLNRHQCRLIQSHVSILCLAN